MAVLFYLCGTLNQKEEEEEEEEEEERKLRPSEGLAGAQNKMR